MRLLIKSFKNHPQPLSHIYVEWTLLFEWISDFWWSGFHSFMLEPSVLEPLDFQQPRHHLTCMKKIVHQKYFKLFPNLYFLSTFQKWEKNHNLIIYFTIYFMTWTTEMIFRSYFDMILFNNTWSRSRNLCLSHGSCSWTLLETINSVEIVISDSNW